MATNKTPSKKLRESLEMTDHHQQEINRELSKLHTIYLDRLKGIDEDLRQGRVKLAHAKVLQLIKIYEDLKQAMMRPDPWN